MSEFVPPSLDQSWQTTSLQRTFSDASKILSDDDLESLSLSETPSEGDLGDDPWDDTEDTSHNGNEKVDEADAAESDDPGVLTALSDNEEHLERLPPYLDGDAGDAGSSASAMDPSSEGGSDSTFSFSFPDPLSTSLEYAGDGGEPVPDIPDPQDVLGNLANSRAETVDVVEEMDLEPISEVVLIVEPIAIEKPTQAVTQPRFATPSRSSVFYAAGIVVSAILIGYLTQSFYHGPNVASIFKPESSFSSISGNWITSLISAQRGSKSPSGRTDAAIPLRTVQAHPEGSVPSEKDRVQPNLPNSGDSPSITRPGQLTSQKKESNPPRPMVTITPLVSFTPTSSSVVKLTPTPIITPHASITPNSLSVSFSKITTALTTKLWDFSHVVLHDLQEVLDIINEILRFIRADLVAETVQQQSRSTVDYIMKKFGERHERAKSNARRLWRALTDLTDLTDQQTQSSWQKTETA